MKLLPRILLSSVVLAVLPVAQTLAADYDPPIFVEEAPEYVPVEVGSGWYLRGDVGYNFHQDHKKFDLSFSDPYTQYESIGFSETKTTVGATIGMGYHFNDFLRTDLNLGFLSTNKAEFFGTHLGGCGGTLITSTTYYDGEGDPIDPPSTSTERVASDCYSSSVAKSQAWTGMANVYADLGTFVGLTPYVGAGIGLVYTPVKVTVDERLCKAQQSVTGVTGVSETTQTFLCDGQDSLADADVEYPGTRFDNNKVSLAYSLGAGFAYRVSQNTSVDFGYQYVTAPDAQYVTLRDGTIGIGEGIDYHQIKLGLRYDLW